MFPKPVPIGLTQASRSWPTLYARALAQPRVAADGVSRHSDIADDPSNGPTTTQLLSNGIDPYAVEHGPLRVSSPTKSSVQEGGGSVLVAGLHLEDDVRSAAQGEISGSGPPVGVTPADDVADYAICTRLGELRSPAMNSAMHLL